MIRWLKSYLIRKRFEALLVKPYEAKAAPFRSRKIKGAGRVNAYQIADLHACLSSSRDSSPAAGGAGR